MVLMGDPHHALLSLALLEGIVLCVTVFVFEAKLDVGARS